MIEMIEMIENHKSIAKNDQLSGQVQRTNHQVKHSDGEDRQAPNRSTGAWKSTEGV